MVKRRRGKGLLGNAQSTTAHKALQHTKYYNAQSTATHNALQHTKHYNAQSTTTHKVLLDVLQQAAALLVGRRHPPLQG